MDTHTKNTQSRFRAFVPTADEPRYPGFDHDAITYADMRLEDSFNKGMFAAWNTNTAIPFRGITEGSVPTTNLYPLGREDAPTAAMVEAARAMLSMANASQLQALQQPLDSPAWRRWSNPEIYANRHGLRLDEIGPGVRLRSSDLRVV